MNQNEPVKKRMRLGEWLEKAMATQSSTLAWKIPGAEEPGGLHLLLRFLTRGPWTQK